VLGGGAAWLVHSLKIGSSFRVQSHQFRTKTEIVALSGGFFFGCAQREPAVFLGGMKKLPRYSARIFILASA